MSPFAEVWPSWRRQLTRGGNTVKSTEAWHCVGMKSALAAIQNTGYDKFIQGYQEWQERVAKRRATDVTVIPINLRSIRASNPLGVN